jgi:hypothetical protein
MVLVKTDYPYLRVRRHTNHIEAVARRKARVGMIIFMGFPHLPFQILQHLNVLVVNE